MKGLELLVKKGLEFLGWGSGLKTHPPRALLQIHDGIGRGDGITVTGAYQLPGVRVHGLQFGIQIKGRRVKSVGCRVCVQGFRV